MISEYDLGWFVGILEGEGHFGYYSQTQRVVLRMVDEDIVRRAARIIEQIIGKPCKVTEEMYEAVNRQPTFLILIYGESARAVMRVVVNKMGYRRRKKIHQALNGYNVKTRDYSNIRPVTIVNKALELIDRRM